MTYTVTKIKTANYIINRQDPWIQLVKGFEKRKAAKGLKSVLKDGKKYAEELDVAFTYDETKTTLTSKGKTTEVEKAALKLIREYRTRIINNRYKTEYNDQKWLGALTALQYIDVVIEADSLALLQTWKNIPHIALRVIKHSIKQQLLATAIKRNTNYINKSKTSNIECATTNKKQSLIVCVLVRLLRRVYTHHGYSIRMTLRTITPNHGTNNDRIDRRW